MDTENCTVHIRNDANDMKGAEETSKELNHIHENEPFNEEAHESVSPFDNTNAPSEMTNQSSDIGANEVRVETTENDKVNEEKNLSFFQKFKNEIVQLRWRMLILLCLMPFGPYFMNDFPGSIGTGTENTIQSKFVSHGKEYTQTMNLALYSVYSYPNCVLCFVGGLLLDKYLGVRKAALLFVLCIFIGAVLFYIAVLAVNYPLLVVGRFIYALGGESCSVALMAILARYFASTKFMAFAFSFTILACRIYLSLTFMFSPLMAKKWGIDYAVLAGVVTCGISLVSTIIIVLVDLRAEARGIVVHQDMKATFHFRDVFKVPVEIWIISAICLFIYCTIFPFNGIAKNLYTVKYDISQETASLYVSIYTYTSAVLGVFVGFIVDRIRRYPIALIGVSTFFIINHILLIAAPIPPYIMSVLLGINLSLLPSNLWTQVPIVADMSIVGFCYGVITAIQNIGLATWPVINGVILDANTPDAPPQPIINGTSVAPDDDKVILPTMKGYRLVELFLIITAAVSLSLSVLLLIVNRRHGGILLKSSDAITEYIRQRDEKLKIKAEEESNSSIN